MNEQSKHDTSRAALSRLEILVLVGIVGVLISLLVPDSRTRTRRSIERRARKWEPGPGEQFSPHESIIAADLDITGHWSTDRHRNFTKISVSKGEHGGYIVAFYTGGCLGSCEFRRKATFREGILKLDGAVAEYIGGVGYNQLYAVKVAGAEMLVPQAFVREFQAGLSDDYQAFTADTVANLYALRRNGNVGQVEH